MTMEINSLVGICVPNDNVQLYVVYLVLCVLYEFLPELSFKMETVKEYNCEWLKDFFYLKWDFEFSIFSGVQTVAAKRSLKICH